MSARRKKFDDLQEPAPPKNVQSRPKAVKKQFAKFPEWTSAHAVPLMGYFSRFCCLLWTIVFLAAFALMVWQVVLTIITFLHYDVTVQQEVVFDAYKFPAVTICDLNPMKRDPAYKIRDIELLMDAYQYALMKGACGSRNSSSCSVPSNATLDSYINTYGLNSSLSGSSLNSKVQRLLNLVASQYNLTDAQLEYDDFIQGCSFNTQDCEDNKTMGTCFTFNGDGSRTVNRVGPIYGLRAILKTNVSQLLPSSTKGGFRVLVHHADEYPFPDIYGVDVQIGSAAALGVGRPFSCTYIPHSTEGCMRSEYQQKTIKACDCYDPAYPAPGNNATSPACTLGDYSCWIETVDNHFESECTQPCHEFSFETSVSFARWPSGSSSTIGACMSNDYYPETCLTMYEQNGALLQVFFEQQSYESMKEVATNPPGNLLSSFGGQLGLWIGGSVIMVIEALLLALQCLCVCCTPRTDKLIGY